ncbi:hypothetical protein ABPG75_002159 [Micractinium tetrahymenae]
MRRALLLVLLALAAARCCLADGPGGDDDVDRKRHKRPWFCHNRDCPEFHTVREEMDYTKRCYEKSTWAVSCVFDVCMPDGVMLANARVLAYVRENDLWGGTPFANLVHLSFDSQAAWENASALATTSAFTSAADLPIQGPNSTAWERALGSLHKTVCAAYFLPNKYQGTAARTEVDRRPPRPSKDSHVRIYRAPRYEAFASGFAGFPSPPRFVFQAMRLAHALRWHGEDFKWGTVLFYVYNSPAETTGRWNEVLIPARPMHELLLGEGEDLFAGESNSDNTKQAVKVE